MCFQTVETERFQHGVKMMMSACTRAPYHRLRRVVIRGDDVGIDFLGLFLYWRRRWCRPLLLGLLRHLGAHLDEEIPWARSSLSLSLAYIYIHTRLGGGSAQRGGLSTINALEVSSSTTGGRKKKGKQRPQGDVVQQLLGVFFFSRNARDKNSLGWASI